MFVAEVRFYREIAPVIGVRVPECLKAEDDAGATLLWLEDLSDWRPGAKPTEAARVLAGMHDRWQGIACTRWPWLRKPGEAADVVGSYFDGTWPAISIRPECTTPLRDLGERLVGRIPVVERLAATAGPATLVHGDASLLNLRTSASGEVALLDWEDVGVGPGVGDLAWLLVSSVDPALWDETISAFGQAAHLVEALPAASSQAILSLADTSLGSDEARGWVRRIEEAIRRMR